MLNIHFICGHINIKKNTYYICIRVHTYIVTCSTVEVFQIEHFQMPLLKNFDSALESEV